jgi:Holliday junction resolvasome RuvABC DNA-binding subunit
MERLTGARSIRVLADRNAQVFAGLRTMGFKERDCRTAVERCSKNLAATATREEMLRAALGMLAS